MKTHKERVEELNKYLSNLSEHHDMYVQLTSFFPSSSLMNNTGHVSGRDNSEALRSLVSASRCAAAISLI